MPLFLFAWPVPVSHNTINKKNSGDSDLQLILAPVFVEDFNLYL